MTTWMTAFVVVAHLCSRNRACKHVAEIEHHLPAWRQTMRCVKMCFSQTRLVKQIFTGRMLLRIKVVNNPRRREDPVFETLVIVTVLRVSLQHLAIDSPRQRCPLLRLRHLSIHRVCRYAKPRHRNESVVLAVRPATSRARREELIHQMPLAGDLVPISLSLRRSQIVIQKVVSDTHAIKQVSGSQIDVRLAEAVAPHVIAHSRIHIEPCRRKVLRVTLHLVGECGLGYCKGDVVLCAPLFGRWRW